MTVPLDTRQDIRETDARGLPRAEIARRLGVSRNTVAKYADMGDMSPAAPVPRERPLTAVGPHAAWIDSVPEADLGAPRKQRHAARRVYDRLVAERGYSGSHSAVCRYVSSWRRDRRGPSGGYLELEWAPGTAQVDFGNFRCVLAGVPTEMKLPVVALPHSNARYCVAMRSERSECLCDGLARVFEWVGRAPVALVLDNATEAGGMVRGKVTESTLFSQSGAHYRCQSRYRNPYSGNERGRSRTRWASCAATSWSRSRPPRPWRRPTARWGTAATASTPRRGAAPGRRRPRRCARTSPPCWRCPASPSTP